jgi:hypothetical protein
MEGEWERAACEPAAESAEQAIAGLRRRLSEMRLEVLRLRASRRTLMALLEMQGRQKAVLEQRLERLGAPAPSPGSERRRR